MSGGGFGAASSSDRFTGGPYFMRDAPATADPLGLVSSSAYANEEEERMKHLEWEVWQTINMGKETSHRLCTISPRR